jgi:hypothetical protein
MFINEGQVRLGYPLEAIFTVYFVKMLKDLKPKVHCKWRITPVKYLVCSITAFQRQSTSGMPFIYKHLLILYNDDFL